MLVMASTTLALIEAKIYSLNGHCADTIFLQNLGHKKNTFLEDTERMKKCNGRRPIT